MTIKVEGRKRVLIEGVKPIVDCGRFAVKRSIGEAMVVEADIFADGHDHLTCQLLHRKAGEPAWTITGMTALGNDRWRALFSLPQLGRYEYTLRAWIDHFGTLQSHLRKKHYAGQAVDNELKTAVLLLRDAASRADKDSAEELQKAAKRLEQAERVEERIALTLDEELALKASQFPPEYGVTEYGKTLTVFVDREKARYSTWYELFPRSTATEPGKHGTFRDCEKRLPYIAAMGFDVLYLPPIHPVGTTFRKGPNNTPEAGPGDPGSPWGIGGAEGGHKAIHPHLGTLADFKHLCKAAASHGIEVALDIAWQCSPDHPWVKEHPSWFIQRPDGTIQYAENPPKKYQDIYPINFESDDWQSLWMELKSVFLYWIEQGIRIFRVDNPHTKAFPFWEWVIGEIKEEYPEVIFLSEAFTRPRVKYRLAKLGFTQSYNYFPWRNTKHDLVQYFTELTKTDVREYFRANLWPNTPDILTEYLQYGGKPAFQIRFVLAATLGASYGIYGPTFELCVNNARERGSEEYHDSEKYQVRHWDLEQPHSLREFITRINRIRRENVALQSDHSLNFHPVDNENLLCYSKRTPDADNVIIVVVNVDPYHTQSGWLELPLDDFGLPFDETYQVHDLLSEARYLWHGGHSFVSLNPHVAPAHIFRVRKRIRREQDFEYFF